MTRVPKATVRDSSTSLGMTIRTRSLRFFYHVTEIFCSGVTTELTFENWGRVHRNQLVSLQNALRINSIARRVINLVAAKVAVEFVFGIVMPPNSATFRFCTKILCSF